MAGNSCCETAFHGYVSSMGWQQFISLIIVALAAALLIWGRFRRRKFNFHRDTHCGCAGNSTVPSQNSIIFHARKGEPREIVVKIR
jgi:hypothetical protein